MKTLLTPALQAGFLAAMILTVVQMFTAIPLILEAETYEQAAEPASVVESAPAAPAAHSHTADAVPDHHSAEAAQEEWEPENGWQRTLATASANTVMGVGFALVLVGLFASARQKMRSLDWLGVRRVTSACSPRHLWGCTLSCPVQLRLNWWADRSGG